MNQSDCHVVPQSFSRLPYEWLVLLVILWIFTQPQYTQSEAYQRQLILSTLDNVRHHLDILLRAITFDPLLRSWLHQSQIRVNYRLLPSDSTTYVESKHLIHLVVWNHHTKKVYDLNTIMRACLHEIAHIICPDQGHTLLFDRIEERLLLLSHNLEIVNLHWDSDPNYPHHEDR